MEKIFESSNKFESQMSAVDKYAFNYLKKRVMYKVKGSNEYTSNNIKNSKLYCK